MVAHASCFVVVVSVAYYFSNRRDVKNSAPVLIKFMEKVDWKVHLDDKRCLHPY